MRAGATIRAGGAKHKVHVQPFERGCVRSYWNAARTSSENSCGSHSSGFLPVLPVTVTIEWDSATDQVQVRREVKVTSARPLLSIPSSPSDGRWMGR